MSEKYPNLKNPPITEAIIDIRLKLPNDFNVDDFKSIGHAIKENYPVERTLHVGQAKIRLDSAGQSISTQHDINGYRYQSTDGLNIVQLRRNGYTYNRLHPYHSWVEIKDEAMRIWELYLNLARPEHIQRVALRYINNLNVPLPMDDFKDYLTCPPEVPEGLPQILSSFLTTLIVPKKDSDIYARISQSYEPKVDIKDKIPILLDIDVFKLLDEEFQLDNIVDVFEELRIYKNEVFFNSITDKLLEEYK